MPTKSATVVSAVLTCGMVGVGVDLAARASARTEVTAFLRSHPSVRVDGFDVSALGRGVVLHCVALPGATIRELRLSRL